MFKNMSLLEKPSGLDCCGSGCSPCVFDTYEHLLNSWQENQNKENFSIDHLLRTDLLSVTRFKPFILIEKYKLQEDVFLLKFQAKENNESKHNEGRPSEIGGILPYGVGQYLLLRCILNKYEEFSIEKEVEENNLNIETIKEMYKKNSASNRIVVRAYTPITIASLEKNCCFNVFVKLYKNGIVTNFLNESLVGDILYWRGPCGTFQYKPCSYNNILLICIGTGLAPMVPIINVILNNELDEALLHLMYGVKNIDNIILRDELIKMTHYWNFTLEYYFSQSGESDKPMKFGETVKNKKIDIVAIKEYIYGKNVEKLLVLVCGTKSFSVDVKNSLDELGVDIYRNVHIF